MLNKNENLEKTILSEETSDTTKENSALIDDSTYQGCSYQDNCYQSDNCTADYGYEKTNQGNGAINKIDNLDDKNKKKKTIITYITFIIINTLVVGGLLLFENRSGDKIAGREAFRLLGQNWWYTAIFLSMYLVMILGDSIGFYALLKKVNPGKNIALSLKVSLLGRYYDRLTPWAMGGEPFQIAYLVSSGLKAGDSGAITMSRHIIRFFSIAIAVITILIASRISTNIYVMLAAIISVLFGLVFPVFMLICCFKPKLGQGIGKGVIKLLYKLKIVKNYDKHLSKMQSEVENFLTGIKCLSANKRVIIIIALVSLIEVFTLNSVPFFVLKALGVTAISYWRVLVLCIFVNYSASFAPTPGGAGIAELSFYAIFAAFVSDSYIFWAVLFWRIAVFYLPVFIGFIVQNTEAIAKIIKTKTKTVS